MDWNGVNNELSQAILDADRLGELFDRLGIELHLSDGSQAYRGRCPVHLGEDANFEVRTHGHALPVRWRCFSRHCEEKYKPSLLGLVRGVLSEGETKEVLLRDALAYLKEFVGIAPSPTRRRPQSPPPPPKRLALGRALVRERLVVPSPYFLKRGFSPAVLDALDVGHSPRRRQSVVPVYDDDGILCVGFLARTEYPQCPACKKYHQPDTACRYGQSKWVVMKDFSRSEYLYNYASARASASPFVLLLEGPCDVFRAAEAGVASVAAFGSDLSSVQAKKMAALHKNVVVAYDNDEAGRSGSARAADLLRARDVRTREWSPPERFHDVGDMTVDDIVTWLNRLREKIAEDDEVFGPSGFSM